MTFPAAKAIEVPLLKALERLGGEANSEDVYPVVTEFFPELTEDEKEIRLASNGSRKWNNTIQWVRQRLVDKGELDGSTPGVWRITSTGRERLSGIEKETQTLRLTALFRRILAEYLTEWARDNRSSNPFFRQLTADIQAALSPVATRFGLTIKALGGQGKMRRDPYISLPLAPHKTSKGIYPAFGFRLDEQRVDLCICVAENNPPSDELFGSLKTVISELLSDSGSSILVPDLRHSRSPSRYHV